MGRPKGVFNALEYECRKRHADKEWLESWWAREEYLNWVCAEQIPQDRKSPSLLLSEDELLEKLPKWKRGVYIAV